MADRLISYGLQTDDGQTYDIIPPVPTETERGGIKAKEKTSTDTVEVKIDSTTGKAYVPKPDTELSTSSENYVANKVVATKINKLKSDIGQLSEEKVNNPPAGVVGQILEIETVDESGKPKTYKAVDKPSGGGEVTDEQISNAVDNYMAANPIEETDPTVPAWAKQPQKPSYTASEVGALPDTTKYLPNPKPLSFKDENDNLIETYNGQASKVVMIPTIPKSIKNPYALTFTGSASGTYDGSEPLTINIPSGSAVSDSVDAYYVTPEQFGAVGDGVTDDTEAFRQAIETELPIVCMAGKDYYFANEIVTDKTRINIDGNYSHFTAFRLKINLNDDETNWKASYPHPNSVIQNVYFMNKNNMDYCIKTGVPMKFVNVDVYYYDLWLKNYGDYMDYFVFDNLAINSRPSNNYHCIELSYLGDNHVFRECRFGGYDSNTNYVQVSGSKAVNFIDCVINGNVTIYQSVVNFNGCHFENTGQIIIGDTNLNSVVNFNGCFFFDQYTVTVGKNVFYSGCGFLVNYRTYGGQNDYMSLNTKNCIIFCSTESANTNCNVVIDDLRKSEYPNVVYSGNKVVFTPLVLSNTQKTWGIATGAYTYKFFQSCNPYSIDYGDPSYSTGEESVTVAADTSCVQFRSNYDTYPNMFIHAYRTAPDGSIKTAIIPIVGNYIYDYGETLNGIMWKDVDSIPTPKSTTAIYRNGIYYSAKNYTNATDCICVNKSDGSLYFR